MKFTPNESAVADAIANPFDNCAMPVNAAIGRVAEPVIIQHMKSELGVEIAPYSDSRLPIQFKGTIFARPKRHDGLVFSQGKFQGINETKMAIEKDFVRLPLHEVDVLNLCIKNDLMYLLSFGKCHSIRSRDCEYLGVVNLADVVKHEPSILVDDGHLKRIYLKNLGKHV